MANKPRSRSAQFEFEGPHPVDVAVGNRVRGRRILMGLSQERLGKELGVTFQQVQKYEKGTNRISASRLADISKILEVPPGYFFEDFSAARRPSQPQPGKTDTTDPLNKRETLELVRAYYRISDPRVRQHITALIRSLGV